MQKTDILWVKHFPGNQKIYKKEGDEKLKFFLCCVFKMMGQSEERQRHFGHDIHRWFRTGTAHDPSEKHPQKRANPTISLVNNNVIPLLTGPLFWPSWISIIYHQSRGTWPCPFLVTGNGHGRVTKMTNLVAKNYECSLTSRVANILHNIWLNLQFHWLSITLSLIWLVHQHEPHKFLPPL